MKFLNWFFVYYSYNAFISNDSLGDDFGCSYEEEGTIKIPFYIKHPQHYIKNKINKRLLKNKELSQVITIEIKKIT